jgi:hypothetical protein
MERNTAMRIRIGALPDFFRWFIMLGMVFMFGISYGQDRLGSSVPPECSFSGDSGPEMKRLSEQGDTIWRKDVNSGCSYADHHITINIPVEPDEISDTKITMTNQDVDYNDPQGCQGGPEVDYLYINGNFVGQLQGANDSWSTNIFTFPASYLKKGDNLIFVDTDATNTNCWCVGVGYVEISGKVGFRVTSYTPEDGQENVLWDAPGISVTFSNEVKKESVEGKDTIILEYRNQQGVWTKVTTTVTMVSATKAQVTPSGSLMDGVRYRMRVLDGPQGVLAKGDAELEEGAEWYFWTMVNLEGQTANLFKPNTTKDKLQITWFNVSRNEDLMPYRWVANRIYVLWEPKAGVFDEDEVKEFQAKVALSVNGTADTKHCTIKRPDLYTENEKKLALNTVNFDHAGGTAAQEAYNLKVEPVPQTGTSKVFQKNAAATVKANTRRLSFDYMACSMAGWYGGPVAGDLAAARAEFLAGKEYTRLIYPLNEINATDKGTMARGNGGLNMEYTVTKRSAWWDTDNVVGNSADENVRYVKDLTTNVEKEEIIQVIERLTTLKPASDKFIIGLIPGDGIPGANGCSAGAVILLAHGKFNASTVAHEIGHQYDIAVATGAGCTNEHNNDGKVIEGFNPYRMDNKSYEEGNADYDRVALNLCSGGSYNTPVAPLMNKWGLPTAFRWIRPDNYRHLMTNVGTATATSAALTGDFMIITGSLDNAGAILSVNPIYRTKQRHVAGPTGTGYTAQLFSGPNGTGSSLGLFNFSPDSFKVSVDRDNGDIVELPSRMFAFSIPFDDAAQSLVIRKSGGAGVTINKSDHGAGFPTAAFTNPANNATINGVVNITWTGSDDGGTVHYRLEFSPDGTNWIPISSQMTNLNSFSFDTTRYASGTGKKIALIAYDGFNTTRVETNVTLGSGVSVSSTEPPAGATGVSLDQVVSASFVSQMDAGTFNSTNFVLLKSGSSVPAKVYYDASSRMALLKPLGRLDSNTAYTARLVGGASGIKDSGGRILASNYEWTFTTRTPPANPQVVLVSPPNGAAKVPVSTLVGATFANALDGSTVNSSTFTVTGAGGQAVAGNVSYDSTNKSALFEPSADLAQDTTYTATLTTGIKDPQGRSLERPYIWKFTTGKETFQWVRIVKVLSDKGKDNNGDGLYDELVVSFLVEVKASGYYNLNCQLKDKTGDDIEWKSISQDFSQPGVYVMEIAFDGNKIAGRGVDGPYQITNIYIYDQWNSGRYYSYPGTYWTYGYKANEFYSVLRLAQFPDIVVAVNSNNPSIINLDDFATHSKYNVNTLTWKILINTNPGAGVTVSNNRTINIAPNQGFMGYTDVTIEAKDTDGIRMLDTFRVLVLENYRFASAGWYLISLPVQPANTAITSVLAAITGKYESVWSYSGGSWKLYDPSNPGFSDLATMEPGKAYWVKMKQAGNLFALGTGVEKRPINLAQGWNFTGYNSTIANTPTDAFGSIAGRYVSVWAYKGGAWKLYDPSNPGISNLTEVEPGYGLWINALLASEWILP